jgi:transcriptional regulator with XRE-family HTH domain
MDSLPPLLRRLGQIIRDLRTQTGYSQERFGFAIGVHRTYMGHLERGTANPTIKILHLVAEGLGVSVPDLFALAMIEDRDGAALAREARADQRPNRPSDREPSSGGRVLLRRDDGWAQPPAR